MGLIWLYLIRNLISDESDNLAVRLDTWCTASSEYNALRSCGNAYDGSLENHWLPKPGNSVEWIKVNILKHNVTWTYVIFCEIINK